MAERSDDVRFDFAAWPLVVAHHPRSLDVVSFDAYLGTLDRLIATGGPYAYVDVYPPGALAPDMAIIRALARWYEKNRAATTAACVATASVIPSAAMRGVARFFQNITDSGSTVLAASLPAAIEHCTVALRARGLEPGSAPPPRSLLDVA